jgi:hypothetical protein
LLLSGSTSVVVGILETCHLKEKHPAFLLLYFQIPYCLGSFDTTNIIFRNVEICTNCFFQINFVFEEKY